MWLIFFATCFQSGICLTCIGDSGYSYSRVLPNCECPFSLIDFYI
jgi:hypothetical protein